MGTDPIAKAKSGTDHGFPLNLVLQAPSLEQPQVDEIAAMAQATQAERISPHAVRLRNAVKRDGIAARCDERRIDHAWMAPGRRVADLKLLAMDMDSTLITIECIDELGDLAGKKAEIAAITERAMRGELEFEGALRERVAMLKGLELASLQQCYDQRVRLNPGAKTMVETMAAHGARCVLVSGGFTFFTRRVAQAAGFHSQYANTLNEAQDRLAGTVGEPILGREAKLNWLKQEAAALDLPLSETLAIGDGANDLAMINAAGLGLAYRAKPVVAAQADARIDHCDLTAALYFQGYRAEDFARP
jgi:phosphoserine phosphatase